MEEVQEFAIDSFIEVFPTLKDFYVIDDMCVECKNYTAYDGKLSISSSLKEAVLTEYGQDNIALHCNVIVSTMATYIGIREGIMIFLADINKHDSLAIRLIAASHLRSMYGSTLDLIYEQLYGVSVSYSTIKDISKCHT